MNLDSQETDDVREKLSKLTYSKMILPLKLYFSPLKSNYECSCNQKNLIIYNYADDETFTQIYA